MPAKNRMSISLSDEEKLLLDRISNRMQRSRSEVIRIIIREYLEKHPERFDLLKNGTGGPLVKRKRN